MMEDGRATFPPEIAFDRLLAEPDSFWNQADLVLLAQESLRIGLTNNPMMDYVVSEMAAIDRNRGWGSRGPPNSSMDEVTELSFLEPAARFAIRHARIEVERLDPGFPSDSLRTALATLTAATAEVAAVGRRAGSRHQLRTAVEGVRARLDRVQASFFRDHGLTPDRPTQRSLRSIMGNLREALAVIERSPLRN